MPFILLLLLPILSLGCATTPPAQNPLAGTSWRLESIVDAGVEIPDLPADEVSFAEDERGVSVRSCNICRGLYTVGDRTLEITNLACTRRGCPGRLELDRYLAGRARWALDGRRLVLTVTDNLNGIDAELTFVPATDEGD
jgi:heat shock protein HslJ